MIKLSDEKEEIYKNKIIGKSLVFLMCFNSINQETDNKT